MDHALRVLRGEARTVKVELYQGAPVELAVHPSFADQEAARKWLAERAFGRTLDAKEMSDESEQKPKPVEPAKIIDIRPPETT